ncbi:multiple inositol polyphosphate phosphatase 1-like [Drosophila nasuta]|uniref:multiple inositol polyphosphate phosphatase 1-like n=1 Tax=Drosophila nasuta TaxID=42062 RepID=UPI00295E402F|nr:multiple inositol polyphosphate phosphatase 1-like [Drosophila nasuta]XP_060657885.1 multiple inositol polyphosphate phosphatase 1-like [Drosophila nasuta]
MRLLLLTTLLALLEWRQVRSEDDYLCELPQKLYAERGCRATKMWIFQSTLVISKDYINKFKRFDELRDLLTRYNREMSTNSSTNTSCEEDLRWNSNDIDKYAVNQTYEENRNFAKLYQSNFPQLLPKNYNNTYYKLAHTNYKHAEASLRAFTEELFDKSTVPASEDMEYLTKLLHPCEQFKNNYTVVQNNRNKFYDTTLEYYAKLLDLELGVQLTKEDIDTMIMICSLQNVLNPNGCNWCSTFTINDYWKSALAENFGLGYGLAKVEYLNCRLIKDIMSILNSTVSPHVVAYFTDLPIALTFHQWFIRPDVEIHGKLENVRNSFADNFVAVKYYCPAEADMEKEKIAFLYNMDFVQFKFCKTRLCNWSIFLDFFKNTLKGNCDELCLSKKNAGETIAPMLVTILLTVIVRQLVF